MKKVIRNKQVNFIFRNKSMIILWLLGILAFGLGLYGFSQFKDAHFSNNLVRTLGLFVFEWTDYEKKLPQNLIMTLDTTTILDIATILATITIFSSILLIFFSKFFNYLNLWMIQQKSYNLFIGLSDQSISLLRNQSNGSSNIIIEKDKDNLYLDFFQEQGSGIIIGFASESLKRLNLKKMKRCIISTTYDRKNISLAKQIIESIQDNKKKEIFLSISNRDLSVLFKQNIIDKQEKNINIETFSLYENMAKKVFFEHSILGNYESLICNEKDKEELSVVVVGDSALAIELVYHIAFLSTLPSENRVTLYLLDNHAIAFKEKIKKVFPKIEFIPHLSIQAFDVNRESLEFYKKENVWKSTNLTNIYIATDNEEDNLDMAINLQDTTYIRKIGEGKFKTKVLFALYHNLGLGEMINNNNEAFANFFTFANIEETSTDKIMFGSKFDYIAKLIHYDYKRETDVCKTKIEEKWKDANTHERYANRTQALHLDIKLLAFGLKRETSTLSFEKLVIKNKEIFYSKIENYQKIEDQLHYYKSDYFPKTFDDTLLNRVARSEHNRWNAFHYLNGWEYNSHGNKASKQHNCLQPLKDFTDGEAKETYQFDLMSVLSIPSYMAYAGCRLVEIEKIHHC